MDGNRELFPLYTLLYALNNVAMYAWQHLNITCSQY